MPRRRPDRSQQQKRAIPKRSAARVIKLSRRQPDRVQALIDAVRKQVAEELKPLRDVILKPKKRKRTTKV